MEETEVRDIFDVPEEGYDEHVTYLLEELDLFLPILLDRPLPKYLKERLAAILHDVQDLRKCTAEEWVQ